MIKSKIILALAAILLTSVIMAAPSSYGQLEGQQPLDLELEQQQEITRGITSGEIRQDPTYGPVFAGSYIIQLKNETFAPIDNQPQFTDKDKIKPSNIPEKQAEIVPTLKNEYDNQTAEIIEEKVQEYNGTEISSGVLDRQNAVIDEVFQYAIKGFSVENVQDISVFVNDPDIATVEPDPVLFRDSQFFPVGNDRIDQDKAVTSTYRADRIECTLSVDVAVIDGRASDNHPDLNVVQTRMFLSPTASTAADRHGTHVAGTVAARDNLGGIVGVAPGAKIHSMVVCPPATGTCATSNIISSWDWITSNAATIEIASMSIGGGTQTSAATTAINNMVNAGVTFVVAAGNSGVNANNINFCYHSLVICVSALADFDGKCGGLAPSVTATSGGQQITQRDDTIAFFSNYGSAVDIMAPGFEVHSTIPSISDAQNSDANRIWPFIGASLHGSYSTSSGTSMAAPYVAGAAALVKLSNPSFTPAQVKSSLQNNAVPQTQSCDGASKGGLVAGANSLSSEKILNVQPY